MKTPRTLLALALLTAATALTACDDDEVAAPHGHTPADAQLFASGLELTPDVTLDPGVTRVEVRFVDEHEDVIQGLEDGHYTALEFDPPTLATVTPVQDERFFFDVDVQASSGAMGEVTVGYGHDPAADDLVFGPFDVTVQ